jgi:hypothetical protein
MDLARVDPSSKEAMFKRDSMSTAEGPSFEHGTRTPETSHRLTSPSLGKSRLGCPPAILTGRIVSVFSWTGKTLVDVKDNVQKPIHEMRTRGRSRSVHWREPPIRSMQL